MNKSPYDIILRRIHTEKASVLENLKNRSSNRSLHRCQSPKYVFQVALDANKFEIASAIELIYAEQEVRVTAVNTLIVKPKNRRVRQTNRSTKTNSFKKAIVTLSPGDEIPSVSNNAAK